MKSYYVSYTVCISYISIKLEEKKIRNFGRKYKNSCLKVPENDQKKTEF